MRSNIPKFNPAVLEPEILGDYHTNGPSSGEPRHFLYPGQIYVAQESMTISTILGSCAALCLWDRRRKIGGMNNYLLPDGPSDGPNRFRYGNVANPALLNEMLSLGCNIRDMQAMIFGGSSAFAADPISALGSRNVEVAEAFLRTNGIIVVERDVSGKHGRKLTFNVRTGAACIKNYDPVK